MKRKLSVWGWALVLIVPLFFGRAWMNPWLILFSGCLLGIGFICISVSKEEKNSVIHIFLIALLVRVFVILPFYVLSYTELGFRPGFYFANDGYAYSENGWQIMMLRERGLSPYESSLFRSQTDTSPGSYEFWNAAIYSVTGKSPLALFFMNALVSSYSAILVYLFTRKFFGQKAGWFALAFSAFWPSLLFWSTQNLRDPMVSMMIFLLAWSLIEIRKRIKITFLAAGLVSAYLLSELRKPSLHLFLSLAMVWFFSKTFLWRKMKFLTILLILLGLLFAADFLSQSYDTSMREANLKVFAAERVSVTQWLHYLREVRAHGRSAFLEGSRLKDIQGLLLFLPLGIVYALFAPFPWQVGSTFFFLGALEILALYFGVPFIIRGIRVALQCARSEAHLMLLLFVGFSLLLALIDSNLGTLFRHRAMTMYFVLIFLAVGLSHKEKSRQDVREIPT